MNTTDRGSNQPANSLQVYLDDLSEAVREPLKRLNDLRLRQMQKVPEQFVSADQARRGVNLEIMLNDLISTVEVFTKNHRQPLDDMTALMRANSQGWLRAAYEARDSIRDRINGFLDAQPEDARKLRTDHGDLAIIKEAFEFTIADPAEVPRSLCSHNDALIRIWIKQHMFNAKTPEQVQAALEAMKKEAPTIRVTRAPQLAIIPSQPSKKASDQ